MARNPGKRPTAPTKPAPAAKPVKVVRPPGAKVSPILAPADLPGRLEALRAERDPDATPQERRSWSARLRLIAGLLVVNDDLARSVVQWHAEHFHDLIAVDTFQRWSAEDKWLSKREERQERIREEIERQIGTATVRSFLDDLKKLDVLHEDIADAIVGRRNIVRQSYTDPKTGEVKMRDVEVVPLAFEKRSEAVQALVALDRRRDEKRKGVLGGLPAALGSGVGGQGQQVTVTASITISPQVARAMARAKLIAERAEVEGGGASVVEPEEDDEE